MAHNSAGRASGATQPNVVVVEMPPLRDRKPDILPLAHAFIRRFSQELKKRIDGLDPDAERLLTRYNWPGNIRELRNACENLAVLRAGKVVSPADLDPRFTQPVPGPRAAGVPAVPPTLDKAANEKQLLRQALLSAAGNRTRAAELMGISRRTLHRKLLQWPELEAESPPT